MKPKVAILSGYGINCEYETEYCFKKYTNNTEIVHISKFLNKEKNLMDYQILAIPGGFSYGDDIGSGKVLANKIKYNLLEIFDFIKEGNL
ncbi:MAG: phosphoribosylformylglycinamidine synthase subunit PurQ, partial [Candidatus Altarchaeaceae archaeon]